MPPAACPFICVVATLTTMASQTKGMRTPGPARDSRGGSRKGAPGPLPTDGRRARGERTRLEVLEALLDLVAEGNLLPTAQAVAERAGVALRTVYHHFDDVEELRRSALDLELARNEGTLEPVEPEAGLDERLRAVCRRTRRRNEQLTPIRRAALVDESRSGTRVEELDHERALRRKFLAESFASELSRLDGESRTTLDALDAATSWEWWDYLRGRLKRTAASAERVLELTLRDILLGHLGADTLGRANGHAGATRPTGRRQEVPQAVIPRR